MANWLGEDPPTRWLDPHARTMYREPSHAAPPPPSFNPADHLPPCGQVRTPNSFTGMSQHTQDRTAKLQSLLSKTLGPDQVANRPGGGGTKLSYLEGWRAINLANEIFGYNGWYTDIKYLEADFIDYSPESQRWSIGVTAIVRVRLQDGASHEDVGYGKLENSKSKADALDKCKKEAVTDALKRALRHFGKLLGNCLYDKNYLEGLSKMKAPKPKFDFEGIYKPERDNVRPTASTSAVPPTPASTMPPPPPPAPRPAAAASLPKKEPAKGPPPLPPHLAAQAHRASTVAPRTAAASSPAAPAPGARASSGPTPRRAATVAAPSSVAAASVAATTSTSTNTSTGASGPNPYDRAGAQTEFPLNSDDESMFAAVELGVEGEGGEDSMMGEGGVEEESRTGQRCFEGDSGFGEVDGLGETSFLPAKPPFAAPPSMPTLVPHPQQQQQQRRPSPASTSASDSPKDPSDRLQAAKAAAQERLALAQAKKRREQANSPHTPASAPPHRRATVAADGHGTGAGAGAGGTASASAAELLRLGQGHAHGPALALGTARPPALRPPQAPPSRSNSATSAGSGSGSGGAAGAAPAGRPQAKVAGMLPALAVGAGVVRAATSGGAGAAGGGGGVNVASLGGVSGLVGVSPERLKSATGAAVEVPPQGGFVSARGVKRGVGEGYDPSPPVHSGASGPRASYSPRAPLGELDVDGVTGAVKRQKGSSG